MIPEFVGRLPVLTPLQQLTESELVAILTEPKHAVLDQYRQMLAIEGAKLFFSPEAMKEIARLCLGQGTGARGIRGIMERLMLNVMYQVPSRGDIDKIFVTTAMVRQCAIHLPTRVRDYVGRRGKWPVYREMQM